MANLERHLANIAKFGVPAVVALNRFSADSDAERALVMENCRALGAETVECDHWASGSAGAEELANRVVETIATKPANTRNPTRR